MVCVVGRMRDLILQLSKSSIYSTKPRGGGKIAAEKALSWALAPTGNGLRVSNASARYITIDSITLNGQKHAAGMVAPFSSLEIAPKGVALRTLPAKFSFTTINDYGAVVNHNYPQ